MSEARFGFPPVESVPKGAPREIAPAVDVSLKHWHAGSQCLSDWRAPELKKLRRLVDKVQSLTPAQLRADPGLGWKPHKGPAARGFSRPASLSKDIGLCELRVDGKARVHGALFDATFYLVWLDRAHAVFPD
ncbi:hypothetical protein [Salinarimonas ramus]|uniref:Uncharacterized protein n=1 Tax=Salinarimonas ramus TaxID=690164 RepID=A0A917V384_9HYPH|nr:hypothetical protein [Salinarimonas ramus]GGK28989.1 hypothetical protein GCM10011322_14250 [Salinarimonas ramus]